MIDTPPTIPQFRKPFVGLRAFEQNESYLFFGRNKPIEDLSKRLIGSRFLAVIGSSGSGKSSLVKSGLLPNIFSGFFTVGTNWRVALMRPGENPIGYLAEALTEKKSLFPKVKQTGDATYQQIIEATLRRSENGLLQVYKEAFGLLKIDENATTKKKTDNLLIVVDQFEELFRFRQYEKENNLGKSDAQHFIKILLTAAQQSECPNIYVLLTMRSDFLGDCSEFNGLPEAINNGQYLVPRMTRDEIREGITQPIAVGGAVTSPRLVTRILNDINNDTDQLPILQHAMMRTWDAWSKRMISYWEIAQLAKNYSFENWKKWLANEWAGNEAKKYPKEELEHRKEKYEKKLIEVWEQSSSNNDFSFDAWFKRNPLDTQIDFDDYDKIGTLKLSLSQHADEAYSEFKTEADQKICELMFRALTDKTADARGTRRPRKVIDLCLLTNATQAQVINQVEVFRKPGRTFLMPPPDKGELTDQSIIDISHESLMRVWERLVKWTEEEAQSGDTFKRLAEDAKREANKVGSLWVNPELEIGLKWKEKFNNNDDLIKVWAKSYNANVDQALKFLSRSNEAAIAFKEKEERLIKEEQERKEAEAKRIRDEEEKERKRKRNYLIAGLIVLFLGLLIVSYFLITVSKARHEAEDAKNAAMKSDSLAQIARDKAIRSDSLAQIDRDKAILSDSLAQIDRDKAILSDSLAQIARDGAIIARDKAKEAEKRARDAEANAVAEGRTSAVGEYQRLIREGPEDKDSILNKNNNFQYKVVAYCKHLDFLRDSLRPDSLRVKNAVKKNNELYEKLYFSLKALKAVDNAIALENSTKAIHIEDKDKVISITANNGLNIAATQNNCLIVNSTDTIYMGKLVTALSYSEKDNIIFFGLVNGEIGFIKYQKNKKNQPVFNRKNDLRSKISALGFFTKNDRNYLLATSYAGSAVLFEFDSRTISDQLTEDKKFPVIELPEYYGEIENAKYDGNAKIQLETSKGTYLWNPFTDDILQKLEAILVKPDNQKLEGIKKSTRIYN
ncbi:MAG: hypothetical protein ABI723_20050 [Bacteroidia bacterium]